MKVPEQHRNTPRTAPQLVGSPRPSARMLWIGNGYVTAAEMESWQLGPDLTEALAEEDRLTTRHS